MYIECTLAESHSGDHAAQKAAKGAWEQRSTRALHAAELAFEGTCTKSTFMSSSASLSPEC